MQAVRTYAQQVFERFVEERREIAEQQVAADLRKILVKHLFWRNHTHKLDSFEPSRRKEDISISVTYVKPGCFRIGIKKNLLSYLSNLLFLNTG